MASCSDGAASTSGGVATTSQNTADPMAEHYDMSMAQESDTLKPETECGDDGDGDGDADDPQTCMDEECRFKPPTPCPPVVDLRGREVIFAIAVFFLFSVSIGLIVILATTKLSEGKAAAAAAASRTHKNNARDGTGNGDGGNSGRRPGSSSSSSSDSRLCLSKECLGRAAYMLDTMDRAADPCTDFFQYSCGGWLRRAVIPPFSTAWSVDHEINARIKADIRRKVEAPVAKVTHDSVDRKVKVLYRKCMEVDAIDALGNKPILDVMNAMGGWALNADWNIGEKSGMWNFQHALEELHFTYWRDSFFVVWVGADHKQSDTNIIQIDQSGIGMDNPESYSMNDTHPAIVKYKQYMRDLARLFTASEKDIEQFVETTFTFEKQLAQIMVPQEHESRRDPGAMYNPLTVTELQAISPWINWLRFLSRNFTDVTKDTVVVVTSRDYMANMSKLIETAHPRTLNYYLMWRLVTNFAKILSKPFRKAILQLGSTSEAPGREEARWRTCEDVLDEWLGMAVGAMYIKDNFPKASRDEVIDIIGHIRQRFKRRLRQIDWMDEPTKKHALEKVNRMTYKIGYPPFLLNEKKVEQFYQPFHINENDTFFQTYLNGIHYEIHKMVHKLKESASSDHWEMNPQAVNAYYAATDNQMVFPAGILQLPYYNPGLPRYVNFGSIGSTIGHEMIHGFDVFGGLYDASGNLNRWWSDTSWGNFENRTRCIADFYSSFTINGFPIDGDVTLGENIADIGGITQAYKAYKTLEKKIGVEATMPGLGLNNDQTFFLAYGQPTYTATDPSIRFYNLLGGNFTIYLERGAVWANWCIKRTAESLRDATMGSSHAPAQIRVNATLSQVPQFADTFNCARTSPMYPRKRCTVW